MRSMTHLLLAVVLGCLAAPLAQAHEGHFHPDQFSTVNASSILVAQCSAWKAPAAAGAVPSSLVDSTGMAMGPVSVTGTLKLWASLKYDCMGQYQTAIEPNVTMVRSGGVPFSVVAIQGFTQTGTCAQGGGERYVFNATADPEELDNQLFINAFNTTADGKLAGTVRQDHVIATGGANGPKSFIFYYDGTENAISCCDLAVAAPNTNYTSLLVNKGQECAPVASAHGAPSSTGGASTIESGMAGMNMGAPAAATAGAASVTASAFMVLMAMAAPMLVLMA